MLYFFYCVNLVRINPFYIIRDYHQGVEGGEGGRGGRGGREGREGREGGEGGEGGRGGRGGREGGEGRKNQISVHVVWNQTLLWGGGEEGSGAMIKQYSFCSADILQPNQIAETVLVMIRHVFT